MPVTHGVVGITGRPISERVVKPVAPRPRPDRYPRGVGMPRNGFFLLSMMVVVRQDRRQTRAELGEAARKVAAEAAAGANSLLQTASPTTL